MARIHLDNVSVTYYLRKGLASADDLKQGKVGAPISVGPRYLEIAALRNLNLEFNTGDRVGLIGVNGSGKSTLLRLCAGALAATKGKMTVEGQVSPQFSLGAGLKSSLSGRRNAELKCLYMGTPQRQIGERVEQIKETSDLGAYFELPISSYSAGMRSRLVMSMMKLVRADILIMDEWIGAADATVSHTVNALQADLIERSSMLIIASHSEGVLQDWTNRLIWLERGQVREDGPIEVVLPHYREWIESVGGGKRKKKRRRAKLTAPAPDAASTPDA